MPEDNTRAEGAQNWTRILNHYREPNGARSLVELAITLVPLAALWTAMWAVLHFFGAWWLCLLIAVPTAGFLVRLFMIQHDCGHGAFFPHKAVNDWTGRLIGVLTMTPYDFWRRTHSMHHATSGNLDRRGMGDIDTLTVREYLSRSRLGRLQYRLYRHPLVMFGFGPAYLFLLQHRLPVGLMRAGWQPWLCTMATNAAMALIAATLIWFIGLKAFLLVHLPVMLLAASLGVWLFYVQHQFEDTYWDEKGTGICMRRRCTAPRITICRRCCAGSPPISASIMCIICAAGFPITGCRECCAIIPSSAISGGSRCAEPHLRAPGAVGRGHKQLVSFRELRASMVRACR